MRHWLAHRVAPSLTGLLPVAALQRFAASPFLLPCYHLISDQGPAYTKHLFNPRSIAAFEADLNFLQKHFQPAAPSDLADWLAGNVESAKGRFLITIDDGLSRNMETFVPILERRGLSAVFFVNSAFVDNREMFFRHQASLLIEKIRADSTDSARARVDSFLSSQGYLHASLREKILAIKYAERGLLSEMAAMVNFSFSHYLATHSPYLTIAQLRDLEGRGFFIGAHSIDHPIFSEIAPTTQHSQIEKSLGFSASIAPRLPGLFAFPFNAQGVRLQFARNTLASQAIFFGTGGFGANKKSRFFDRITMERPAGAAGLVNLAAVLSRLRPSATADLSIQ